MNPLIKGLVVAAVHLGIVLTLAGKYTIDRERLPRVWAKAVPYDPNMPIRGRYVSLRLHVENAPNQYMQGVHYVRTPDGRLSAELDEQGTATLFLGGDRALTQPIPFFIPEHIPDPSTRAKGEELWVEVSLPRKGPPRPIRLGVKKDGGAIQALEIN